MKVFSWIWENTDNITKWIQAAALIVAGYWAYTRFFRVEAPSLETAVRLELSSKVDPLGSACRVIIHLVIHNEGHSSFEVGKVRIAGWRSIPPQASEQTSAYFDVDKMEREPVERVLFVDPPSDLFLNRHYPPGGQFDQDFVWEFKKLNGLYLIRADAYDPQGKLLSNARQLWQWSCP